MCVWYLSMKWRPTNRPRAAVSRTESASTDPPMAATRYGSRPQAVSALVGKLASWRRKDNLVSCQGTEQGRDGLGAIDDSASAALEAPRSAYSLHAQTILIWRLRRVRLGGRRARTISPAGTKYRTSWRPGSWPTTLRAKAMMIASSSSDSALECGTFGPIRRSATDVRRSHFATVFWLIP